MTFRTTFCIFLLNAVMAFADGLIIVPPEHPNPQPNDHFTFTPLEVKYHRVNVTIKDQVAITKIDQAFYNPSNRRLEGTYIFPLPVGAHIDKFSMDVNGKQMEAELLDAEKARKLYEDIVRKAKDPALMEYVGRGAFKVRIFPIEPRSTKPISITYSEFLPSDSGLLEYVYPLNTEKFSAAPLQDVSVKVDITTGAPIKSIYCPSHEVEITRHGQNRAVVGFEEKQSRPDSDFKLVFSRHTKTIGMDLLTHCDGKDSFFMLMASPGAVTDRSAVLPKDLCFVLDTSGSMMGKKLKQARKALQFCIENMNEGDRFEIVRFSTEAEQLFGKLTPVSPASQQEARDFANKLKPIGGTAINEALKKALSLRPASDDGRPYHVVFITDGLPTVGETREDNIVSAVSSADNATRIFSFGLGDDVNTHLLDRISEDTRATSQYVLPEEDLEVKLSSFYTKIADPVLANVGVKVADGSIRLSSVYPNRLPDLFNGDQLVIFGKYDGSGDATLDLTGVVNGERRNYQQDVKFATEATNPFIPAMWATRRVGWLLDEIRRNGESKELKDEIILLARKYGIVTPYTAYLIMEDEAIRNVPVRRQSMRELSQDNDAVSGARTVFDSLEREAKSEEQRSGQLATRNATDLNKLKYSANRKQMRVPRSLQKAALPASAGYRAKSDYTQQVRVMNGRAFYQNGSTWSDATAQSKKGLKEKQVKFNSEEYFELLRQNDETAQWLSMGTQVDLVIGDTLYQVR